MAFNIRPVPQIKLDAMKRGVRVITNDRELDAICEIDDDATNRIRSVPNSNRVGVLDQYVAWIVRPVAVEIVEGDAKGTVLTLADFLSANGV